VTEKKQTAVTVIYDSAVCSDALNITSDEWQNKRGLRCTYGCETVPFLPKRNASKLLNFFYRVVCKKLLNNSKWRGWDSNIKQAAIAIWPD